MISVFKGAIICVASSIGQLSRLEGLLAERFSKEYVIEVAESSMEVMNIIATLQGIGVETGVVIATSRIQDMSGLDLISSVERKYPGIKMMMTVDGLDMDTAERVVNDNELFCLVREPWEDEQMAQLVADACRQFESDRELDYLMRQLRMSEQEKNLILQSISEAIIFMDLNREILWKNSVADKELITWESSGACYKEVFGLASENDDCPVNRVIENKEAFSIEKQFGDGSFKLIRFFPALDQGNMPVGVVVTLLDITERVVANNMNRSLLEMSRFINSTDSIVAMYSKAHEYLSSYFNMRLMCVAGEDFDDAYVEFINDTEKKLGREQVLAMLRSLQNIITKNRLDDFIMMENELGTIIAYPMGQRMLMIIAEEVISQDSSAIRFINTIAEQIKTGMNKIENLNKITFQANHDSGTGLFNRDYFIEHLRAHLDDKRTPSSPTMNHSVAIIDLNYFKDVNDNFSHIIGDKVLFEIADRLKSAIRGTDVVGRIGGDEFAVLFVNHDRREITRMIRRLQKEIARPVIIEENVIEVGSSIGIVYDIYKYDSINNLLRDADKAMYEAKKDKSGIGRYKFFEKAVQKKVERYHNIEQSLRGVDYEKDLRLMYQPIIRLSDMSVRGYEGFLRWDTPDGRGFMPDEFIPIANESDAIIKIGRKVIQMALDAVHMMDDTGMDDRYVNVNLTSRQLMNKQHMDMVKKSVVDDGIASSRLRFDITDGFKDSQIDDVARNINELNDFGVKVNLDDFGTGTSSLVALNRMDVQEIKIDSSYISKIRFNEKALRMVRSIIDLAKSLRIEVTAEGVERQEELDILKSLGCDNAQGYYFSKPVSLEKAMNLEGRKWTL